MVDISVFSSGMGEDFIKKSFFSHERSIFPKYLYQCTFCYGELYKLLIKLSLKTGGIKPGPVGVPNRLQKKV